MKKITNLTPMDWKVYNYIKARSMELNWTTQKMILKHLEKEYDMHTELREVRRSVNSLRDNDKIQKVILGTTYGYKLLTDESELIYLDKRLTRILGSLSLYHKDISRLNKNGQFNLTSGEYERDYIESLLNINETYELEDRLVCIKTVFGHTNDAWYQKGDSAVVTEVDGNSVCLDKKWYFEITGSKTFIPNLKEHFKKVGK